MVITTTDEGAANRKQIWQSVSNASVMHLDKDMKLRNSRLKRKLNSKVAFESRIRSLRKPKKYKTKIIQKRGQFTSGNVTLQETALNNKILRIHLTKQDLPDIKPKPAKSRRIQKQTKPRVSETKLSPYRKPTLIKSPNLLNTSFRQSLKQQLNLPLYPKITETSKMVVNNGKVSKYDPDDYILKRIKSKHSKILYLKPVTYKGSTEGKLNYKFHQLVNDVKNMQLPTPSWKIKVIIRHNKIAAIIFTNKAVRERSVSFNSDDDRYHIVIDNKPAILVGSPAKVDSCTDIEVLLSIMETISTDNPMITYT